MTEDGNGTAARNGMLSGDGVIPVGRSPVDDPVLRRSVDRADMLGAIAGIPDQVADAWRLTCDLVLPQSHVGVRSVAVLGMGGSAIGGDLVAGIWANRLRAPLTVVRGYELPAWVDTSTLVVASSNSGNTEETISALGAAVERGSPIVAVTTGGALRTASERGGFPLLSFPGGGTPRAAVGYSIVLLAGLLERAGLLELESGEVQEAAAAARGAIAAYGPTVATEGNLAKQLAWTLLDRLPVIEAGGFLAPVARRWKTQLNEKGKSNAAWETLPEATHNTVVGYPHPEVVIDQLHVVFLESPLDHTRDRLRAALSIAALDDAHIGHSRARVTGGSRFAQALKAIVLGDYVSTYLALLYGTDPTPIDALVRIKEAMAAADLDVRGPDPTD
jgi:glucose/mannose-6-phosphate isomerase